MNAVQLFENPVLDEVAKFAENNKNVGPKWAALSKLLTERVLPARSAYCAALDAAAKVKEQIERQHDETVKMRAALVEQIAGVDFALAEQFPRHFAEAEAAPVRIAEEANTAFTEAEIGLIVAAIDSLAVFRA